MLDNAALQQLVEQQVKQEVSNRVQAALNEQWLKTVEDNAIKFIQDRIVAKFANSSALPELLDAVKKSVKDLFTSGQMPGLGQYVDHDDIKKSVNDSTQELVVAAINNLTVDPAWIEKIETIVNQNVARKIAADLSKVDLGPIIKEHIDSTVRALNTNVFKGIQSLSDNVELTVLDQHVVVENQFTANTIEAVESLVVKNLVVKGSINTDNRAWIDLSADISKQTLAKLDIEWQTKLTKQVSDYISSNGIDFLNIKVDGESLIKDGKLSSGILESNLRVVGTLQKLNVTGETNLGETVSINKKRMGINTAEPDMALSVWDEEVTISAGKFKAQTGFIGTTRKQALAIGVNKTPAIEIDDTGLTAIKKVQIGIHKISHGNEVPNYSGTKGDIVFNANPTLETPVFAWQCLGGFKWKIIKAVE